MHPPMRSRWPECVWLCEASGSVWLQFILICSSAQREDESVRIRTEREGERGQNQMTRLKLRGKKILKKVNKRPEDCVCVCEIYSHVASEDWGVSERKTRRPENKNKNVLWIFYSQVCISIRRSLIFWYSERSSDPGRVTESDQQVYRYGNESHQTQELGSSFRWLLDFCANPSDGKSPNVFSFINGWWDLPFPVSSHREGCLINSTNDKLVLVIAANPNPPPSVLTIKTAR